jgi:GNAT superfamily N-acetyltransferase
MPEPLRVRAEDARGVLGLIAAVSASDGWPLAGSFGAEAAASWLVGRRWHRQIVAEDVGVIAYAGTYFVDLSDPSLAGWVAGTGRKPDELIALGGLMVRPDRRRRGVARELLEACVASVLAEGLTPVLATLHGGESYKAALSGSGASNVGRAATSDGRPVELWAWL